MISCGKSEPYKATQAVAIKRVVVWQLEQAMNKQHISKTEMARRMDTSRSQLDRLLDPGSESVTLETLARAAWALGRRVKVELVSVRKERDASA